MAEQFSIFGLVVGVALLLTGVGLVILTFTVSAASRRRTPGRPRPRRGPWQADPGSPEDPDRTVAPTSRSTEEGGIAALFVWTARVRFDPRPAPRSVVPRSRIRSIWDATAIERATLDAWRPERERLSSLRRRGRSSSRARRRRRPRRLRLRPGCRHVRGAGSPEREIIDLAREHLLGRNIPARYLEPWRAALARDRCRCTGGRRRSRRRRTTQWARASTRLGQRGCAAPRAV